MGILNLQRMCYQTMTPKDEYVRQWLEEGVPSSQFMNRISVVNRTSTAMCSLPETHGLCWHAHAVLVPAAVLRERHVNLCAGRSNHLAA